MARRDISLTATAETSAFGGMLRLLRQKRGLSLRSVVAQAGIAYATLSYWENGKTHPRLPELERVLQVLTISTSERRTLLRLLEPTRSVRDLYITEGAVVPPIGGDLLWSMRLRQGETQADAARAIGIHQAQIARWERGESWPSTEKLHALCWHLDATPEEVAALTTGVPTGEFSVAADAMIPAKRGQGAQTASDSTAIAPFDLDQWGDYVRSLLHVTPADGLSDLTLLTVENRLNHQAEHDAVAATLLPMVYGIHARLHLNAKRLPQAAFYAERGLANARRQRDKGNLEFATLNHSCWFGSVIVVGTAAARTNTRTRHQHAVNTLEQWLPILAQNGRKSDRDGSHSSGSTHQAWGLSTLAILLNKMRRDDEALAVSQQSCRRELSPHPHNEDYIHRHFTQVELLMRMGRHRQALNILEHSDERDHLVSPRFHTRRRELQEQCVQHLRHH